MTEPPQQQALSHSDPTTAILLIVTEVRGELRTLVADLKRHDTEIAVQGRDISELKNRATALETRAAQSDSQQSRTMSARSVMWTAMGTVVAAVAIIVTVILANKP